GARPRCAPVTNGVRWAQRRKTGAARQGGHSMVRDKDYRAWMEAATLPPAGQFLEEVIQDVYQARLEPGEMAVDCGANRGFHTMPMSAAVGPTGEVLAIEALPTLAEELSRKLASSGCETSL